MRSLKLVLVATLTLSLVGLSGVFTTAQEKKADPKFKIADVMKEAMKGGLCTKVAEGKASKEEMTTLVEMFTALGQNTPPKGEAASWKEKTSALVAAAKECVDKKEGAGDKLKKAANCMACHSVHRGK